MPRLAVAALVSGFSLATTSAVPGWSALAWFALIGFPASVGLFSLGIDHAKRVGTLDHR